MQSFPKDLKLYVYRMIHKSFMKELHIEYFSIYCISEMDVLKLKVKNRLITYTANYRDLQYIFDPTNEWISGLDFRHTQFTLPKKYIFTSGLNSRLGYF